MKLFPCSLLFLLLASPLCETQVTSTTTSVTLPVTTSPVTEVTSSPSPSSQPTTPKLGPKNAEKDFDYSYNETFCGCDLQPLSCDIGCCCDESCSEDDIKVFKDCNDKQSARGINPHYCYTANPFFSNNSQLAAKQTTGSIQLFCLVDDNLKSHYEFLNRSAVS